MLNGIRAATAAGALAIGLLSGCGGAQPPRAATPSDGPATVSSTPAPAKRYAKADLDAAVLTATDLPAGYSPDPQLAAGDSAMSTCPNEALALDGYRNDAQAKSLVAFGTTAGQFIVQSLTLLSDDPADNTLAALKTAVAGCTTWTLEKTAYTLMPASYGPYGEETLSYVVTVKADIPFTLAVMFTRTANILTAVAVAAIGATAPTDARAIFDRAATKLPTPK